MRSPGRGKGLAETCTNNSKVLNMQVSNFLFLKKVVTLKKKKNLNYLYFLYLQSEYISLN